jgi:hypothetical protein
MSGENEVLPENLGVDVRSQERTYGLETERMVQSVTRDFIFTCRPTDPVFLILELF